MTIVVNISIELNLNLENPFNIEIRIGNHRERGEQVT